LSRRSGLIAPRSTSVARADRLSVPQVTSRRAADARHCEDGKCSESDCGAERCITAPSATCPTMLHGHPTAVALERTESRVIVQPAESEGAGAAVGAARRDRGPDSARASVWGRGREYAYARQTCLARSRSGTGPPTSGRRYAPIARRRRHPALVRRPAGVRGWRGARRRAKTGTRSPGGSAMRA
jgi:hypothetical protein